ncbi:LutC/YkgG family protein [Saccharospirillum salsuginis]|uniref:LUD domain-containing protein n=1 Tax=Saccharospirillum salsuginis TaxID=418750 RepID=A0A918KIS3_9GAMM|nr:lactate utilization protein C [Saccharospirillum salsuginis]GGX65178.1 hypothetical protein GCM10007392_36310 [Saccharospirillum salsuginis]
MSSTAKADILARLRQRTHTSPPPERDFSVLEARQWTPAERIERFRQHLESVQGEVIRTTESELNQAILDRLSRSHVRRLLLGRNSPFQAGLAAAKSGDLELHVYDQPIETWQSELFNEIEAALTTTLGGIAETGSLILWPTPDEPRLMSLVPPMHLAVLRVDQLHDTLLQVVREQRWSQGMPTNALLISGPSKTADIEQTLVFGAHGPRELVVFLVDESGSGA